MKNRFKIGNSVSVKSSVKDPDFGFDLGGWEGRIVEISEDVGIICVEWDSITLGNMPESIISECEERGIDWRRIYLSADELQLTVPRDTQIDVKQKAKQLQDEHAWDHIGPEGRNISKVLAGIGRDDEWEAMKAWYDHLESVLKFPFDAKIIEHQEYGRLRTGDQIIVQGIIMVDDLVGVIVAVKWKREIYHLPLCDLEVVDTSSSNHDFVQEYAVWFANR